MARLAAFSVPGPAPRDPAGNGRAPTCFTDADHALYRDLLAVSCRAAGAES